MPSPTARLGFTLLEVLIVLVLMGVASALVVPAIRSDRSARGPGAPEISVRAQREAIRRAEAIQLRVDDRGAWTLRVARTGAALDSGMLQLDSTRRGGAWTFDALGGCMPIASDATLAPFDALACRATSGGVEHP
jgi:prepilin-type N-terminal cleavage/methylation domain-containing protein